jgi:hypothetical protein
MLPNIYVTTNLADGRIYQEIEPLDYSTLY